MIIKPKIRGFICVTAHPEGCSAHVEEQINYVKTRGLIKGGPKNILIIGASTGYGLSTRITGAFACGAATTGVFFERPSLDGRTATAGWYNSIAMERCARKEGLFARSVNGDAFSDAVKEKTISLLKEGSGKIDLLIYSLASPRRLHPRTGKTYKAVLKPVGHTFTAKNLDTDRETINPITINPASEEEIDATRMVMGGEDWQFWVEALLGEDLLAEGATSIAYSYIGPEVTWPIYKNGTIGLAKKHLENLALKINARLAEVGGEAFISVNKAVVTQASSAIPVVPLYNSILFKVMKEKGTHEGCIEQIYRLFSDHLYNGNKPRFDAEGRLRIDDREMAEDVQKTVVQLWRRAETANLDAVSDFEGYRKDFLKLFGFGLPGVDYEGQTDPVVGFEER